MDDNTIKEQQVAIAERLQLKWLQRMETMIDAGDITSTDMATLVRFLMANGWTLDPTRMPSKLRDKLTTTMSALDFDNDGDVIPLRKQA
jgi:hypothetical protein